MNDKNNEDYDDIENNKNNTYEKKNEITSTSTSTRRGTGTRTIINVTIAFQSQS